jgi:hypothetical protein
MKSGKTSRRLMSLPKPMTAAYHIELEDCCASQQTESLNVRYGSKADMAATPRHVGFTPKIRYWACL